MVKLEISTNPLHAVKGGRGPPGKPVTAHPDKLPGRVPIQIR